MKEGATTQAMWSKQGLGRKKIIKPHINILRDKIYYIQKEQDVIFFKGGNLGNKSS